MHAGSDGSGRARAEALLALPAGEDLLAIWARGLGADDPFVALIGLVLQLLREHPETARRVTERVARAGCVTDARQSLQLERLRAHTAKACGDLPTALEHYARAAEGFERMGDAVESARTVIGYGDALALAGDPARAIALIDRARRGPGRLDASATARLEGTAATVHYLAGQFDTAHALYRRALARARRRAEPIDAAVCTFNLANVELLRGRATAARRLYERARAAFAEHGQDLAALQCEYGLAAARLQLGDWPGAVAEFDRVADELRERGDRRGAAAIDHDAAELLSSLGADAVAETHVRRARADFAAMGLLPERARAAALHARVLTRLGRAHDATRRLEEARGVFEVMGRDDVLDQLDLVRASIDLRRGRSDEGSTLQRIERRAQRRGDDVTLTRVRTLRAEFALAGGRARAALALALRAHAATSRPRLRALRPALSLLVARAHAALSHRDEAVRWARRALTEQERASERFGDRAEASGLGSARDALAIGAIDLVLEHGGDDAPRQALRMLMTVKTGSIVDDLLRGRRRTVREDVRAALARLRDRLLESGEAPDDVRAVSLRGEIHALERRLRHERRPQDLPTAVALQRSGPRDWIRALDGRPIVVFDRRPQRWSAFVIDARARVRHVELPDAERAVRETWIPLRMLFEALARAPIPARDALSTRTHEEARAALRELHAALWEPLDLDVPEVVVVATGALNGLALEAALVEVEGEAAPIVARVPHPELLLSSAPAHRREALLVEGTMPGAADELARIRERLIRRGWGTSVVSTREEFLRAPRRYGLVHLATHGSFHRNRWISNGLRLSDGWIGFEQLDPRRIAGALLYFDSCESGLANDAPGAELDGWANAAFAAGAHETVLHLWKIDDRSATAFASAFYEEWGDGRSAATAAHRARLRGHASGVHPFCWASGVVNSRRPFIGLGPIARP